MAQIDSRPASPTPSVGDGGSSQPSPWWRPVVRWSRTRERLLRRHPVATVAVLVVSYVVSYLPIWLLFGNQYSWPVALLIVAAPVVVAWIGTEFLAGAVDMSDRPRVLMILMGVVLVVAGLGVGWVVYRAFNGLPTEGFGFAAFITGIVVVGGLVTWLRHILGRHLLGAAVSLAVPLAIGVVGFLMTDPAASFWLIIVALLLLPVGGAVGSEWFLRRWPDPAGARFLGSPERICFGLGAAVLLLGTLLTTLWLAPSLPTVAPAVTFAVIAAGILGLVALITADNVGDLILVALAVSFVAFYQSGGPQPEPFDRGADGPVLVALGDSYMSGEGAGDFFDGTNDKSTNECRRSEHAYAQLMTAPELPDDARFNQVISVACSGAVADEIVSRSQFPGIGSQLEQLERTVDPASAARVTMVILSVSGNDAGFGDIVEACIIPGNCIDQVRQYRANVPAVEADLGSAYATIRQRLNQMGIKATVLVVPYPVPIAADGCAWSAQLFDAAEHRFLFDFTNDLNAAIGRAAANAGFYYLDDMAAVFVGDNRMAICSTTADGRVKNPGELGVNFIKLGSVEGTPGQITDPRNWVHNSFHPTVDGHRAMRDALAIWLTDRPDQAAPAPRPSDPGEVVLTDTSEWILQSLSTFLKEHLPWILLAAAGAWVPSLILIRRYRSRRREVLNQA